MQYIQDTIEQIEEICGKQTQADKNKIKNNIIKKYTKLAEDINHDASEILNNQELLFEVSQYIDYDYETAKKIALNHIKAI